MLIVVNVVYTRELLKFGSNKIDECERWNMSEEIRQCGKCGEFYISYLVLFKKDEFTIAMWHRMKEKYDNFCEDCWHERVPTNEYAVTDNPDLTEDRIVESVTEIK